MIKSNNISTYVFIGIMMFLGSCITPYESNIEEGLDIITFDGGLIYGDSIQTIRIFYTTSLETPTNNPVVGCRVEIYDSESNVLSFKEVINGIYECKVQEGDIVPGRSYSLHVETPTGKIYASDEEYLNYPVDIDSTYYIVESNLESFTTNEVKGIQFYVDIKAHDTISKFFRWQLEETWEYTATAPISFFFINPGLQRSDPFPRPDYYRCWSTEYISDLYLSSTNKLLVNEKKRIPLLYVSTETERLRIRYSLFIKQLTMNEEAYEFMNLNKISLQQGGALYTQQPGQAITNLRNTDNPEERVIGYFWAASASTKRMIFNKPQGLIVPPEICELVPWSFKDHGQGAYPKYIYIDPETGTLMYAPPFCFECFNKGGSMNKPSYW